jgi:GNAT superfamily N-acetyltransferase
MRIAEVTGGPVVDTIYTEILQPHFPPAEMCSLQGLQGKAGTRLGLVWAAFDDADTVVGSAIGEWDEDPGVVLLAWLAVAPGRRGGGVGTALLDAAQADWVARYSPCLLLAEVEDPACHAGNEAHGDPRARLRFYQRRGARILDIPYFQASLAPDLPRVPGLLLLVLHADQQFAGPEPDTIDGAVLRQYLELYQRQCEGQVATDEQATLLWEAVDRPGGVPLLPPGDTGKWVPRAGLRPGRL